MLARVAVLATGLALASIAGAEIVAKNAWMRPAASGNESARVYVDIASDTAVELVGATASIAKSVAIVKVGTIGDPATEKVVATFPVPAGAPVRLAYRGDHLRLVDITRDVGNGDPVELTLVFRDKAGKRIAVRTDVTVRGLLAPQQSPGVMREAPAPEPMPTPGPGQAPTK